MKRSASAVWQGSLKTGKGTISAPGGALKNIEYSFGSRFESGAGTNPEELIAAAHSTCFSMALSNELSKAGHTVDTLDTKAEGDFPPGKGLTATRRTPRRPRPGLSAEEVAPSP